MNCNKMQSYNAQTKLTHYNHQNQIPTLESSNKSNPQLTNQSEIHNYQKTYNKNNDHLHLVPLQENRGILMAEIVRNSSE